MVAAKTWAQLSRGADGGQTDIDHFITVTHMTSPNPVGRQMDQVYKLCVIIPLSPQSIGPSTDTGCAVLREDNLRIATGLNEELYSGSEDNL